jgi:hypothetical protein
MLFATLQDILLKAFTVTTGSREDRNYQAVETVTLDSTEQNARVKRFKRHIASTKGEDGSTAATRQVAVPIADHVATPMSHRMFPRIVDIDMSLFERRAISPSRLTSAMPGSFPENEIASDPDVAGYESQDDLNVTIPTGAPHEYARRKIGTSRVGRGILRAPRHFPEPARTKQGQNGRFIVPTVRFRYPIATFRSPARQSPMLPPSRSPTTQKVIAKGWGKKTETLYRNYHGKSLIDGLLFRDANRQRPPAAGPLFRDFVSHLHDKVLSGDQSPPAELELLSAHPAAKQRPFYHGRHGSISRGKGLRFSKPVLLPGSRTANLTADLRLSAAKEEELDIEEQLRQDVERAAERQALAKEQQRLREEEEKRQRAEAEQRRLAEQAKRREQEKRYGMAGLRKPNEALVKPLSEEAQKRVMATFKAKSETSLAQTPEGTALTRRDFLKLIPPTEWLNDDMVIGPLQHTAQYINEEAGVDKMHPKCAALTSFFWPRLQEHGPAQVGRLMRQAGIRKENLLEMETILIPICQNNHWTLAVVFPARRVVSHIDSLGHNGAGRPAVTIKILDWVKTTLQEKFVEEEWQMKNIKAPRQQNGYDCGVFTISNAICMALSISPIEAYGGEDMPAQRLRLAGMILNEGFTGEFSLAAM